MSLLKSYTCSKCAGILMFDSDQAFFECPFCGNHFDEVDFHEDEIMAQAEESLEKEAFSSAKEKFNSILEKEPSDFEALKGLILCEIKTSSLESMKSPAIFDPVDIILLKNLILRVKKQASIKDSEFFSQFLILIDLSDRLKMYQNNIDALYSEDTREKVNNSLSDVRFRKTEQTRSDNMLGPAIVLGGIALGALFSFTKDFDIVFTLSLIGMIIGGGVWAFFNDYNPPKQVYADNPIHDAWDMKNYLESQYEHYLEKYGTEYARLMELNRAAKARTPETAASEEHDEISVVDTDHSETVICDKCAGKLFLDKERRVYECRSCGVAYGISLFFGMPMEKALNAMNTGHYSEAQKRFENILMVDPSSFDTLLGRILCVGKWTRISDIDTLDVISPEDWSKANELISDARKRVTESDKAFFKKLEELIFMLGRICLNTGDLDEMNRRLETLDSIRHLYFFAEQLSTDDSEVSLDRSKLVNDIDRLQKDTRQLAHEFLALKRELIQMKSDCILVK